MRRLFTWLTVLGLLATVAGCYKGRGICDCLDYRDPCCYGVYINGPYGHDHGHGHHDMPMHDHVAPVPPHPAMRGEPLKVMPKEEGKDQLPKEEAKETGLEKAPPTIE